MIFNNLKTNKVILSTYDDFISISLDNILYFKASEHFCLLYTYNNEEIKITKLLKQVENIINNKYFYRCHKSYLINLNYIDRINTKKDKIILYHEKEIPLSRYRKCEFRKYIKKTYNQNTSDNKNENGWG